MLTRPLLHTIPKSNPLTNRIPHGSKFIVTLLHTFCMLTSPPLSDETFRRLYEHPNPGAGSNHGSLQTEPGTHSLLHLRLGCGYVRQPPWASSQWCSNFSCSLVAAGGGVLNYISGYHRPFSLTDIAISYPDKPNIVSLPVLVLVALVAPAGIIFLLCLVSRFLGVTYNPHRRKWLQTLWEIHAGLIGLCASLAGTLFITSGLKDMVGKPRPNLLARCDADLSRISGFVIGGFETSALVTSGICQQTDKRLLDDSFAAFPSGHSSFSCAGLVYLTLWLCARFSLSIPYLDHNVRDPDCTRVSKPSTTRGQSAPPLWQLAAALFPTVVTIFICSSRYADFHHAGFDIICGAILGTAFAFSSFRLYHLPIRRSRGVLAWGERSRSQAFFSSSVQHKQGVGVGEGFSHGAYSSRDTGDNYELRDTEEGENPVRVDTPNSTSPIFYQPHAGHQDGLRVGRHHGAVQGASR